MTDVYLVAPVRAYRDALATVMTADPELALVGHAATGADALTAATTLQPSVVLLDFSLDECVPTLQSLRRVTPMAKLIGIGIRYNGGTPSAVLDAAEAGVSGFVDAEQPLADVLQAVRFAMRGESPCNPRIAAILLQGLRLKPTNASSHSQGQSSCALTPKESIVAELAARGLTNRQIAARLFIGEATVKTHIHSVLRKLELSGRNELAMSGIGQAVVEATVEV